MATMIELKKNMYTGKNIVEKILSKKTNVIFSTCCQFNDFKIIFPFWNSQHQTWYLFRDLILMELARMFTSPMQYL